MVNQILSTLTVAQSETTRELELLPLETHSLVYEEGGLMDHVYFPTNGMISRIARIGPDNVESATIGAEGMLGLALFLGETIAAADCMVRIRGEAWRLPAATFLDLVERTPSFVITLKHYTAARLWVTYRSAGCGLLHSLPSRCARWLLFAHDRCQGDSIDLTHAEIAQLMGVRRVGVTLALGALQRAGIINSRRGRITILDRDGLESASCECAALIRFRYASQFEPGVQRFDQLR